MNYSRATQCARSASRCALVVLLAAAFALAHTSVAQQKDKKKKNAPMTDNSSSNPVIPLNDQQQIDYMISETLGAWQIGDVERLRKNYDDNVSVVSGIWTPPVIGWPNYLAVYQQQRARMQQVRLDRSNTFIRVQGNFAWACYQWDFAGTVDGQPSSAKGQTTLLMEKRDNRWVIVHNHTSLVQGTPAPASPQTTETRSMSPAERP